MAGNDTPLLLLTQLVHSSVVSPSGENLGRLQDVIVRLADKGYPRVTGLKINVGRRELFVPLTSVTSLKPGVVQLVGQVLDLGHFVRRPGEVLLREDVLDRRLIDVVAGRLVNANDLALAQVDGQWVLVGVDPNQQGRLRRLLPGRANRDRGQHVRLLDWNEVQPFVGHVPTAGLLMPLGPLRRLHPAQIADLVERSTHAQGEEIIGAVEADPELTADVFEELDPQHQEEFLDELSNEDAAALLARMAPDDAADLLNELDQKRRLPVLDLLPPSQRQKVHVLLQYNPSTAGGMMNPDYFAVSPGTPLGEVLQRIREDDRTPVPLQGMVFVADADNRFVGAVSAVDVIRGEPSQAIEQLSGLTTSHTRVTTDLADIALLMTDFNLTALAVTDDTGHIVGAISVDDLLEALVPEEWRRRMEDVQRG